MTFTVYITDDQELKVTRIDQGETCCDAAGRLNGTCWHGADGVHDTGKGASLQACAEFVRQANQASTSNERCNALSILTHDLGDSVRDCFTLVLGLLLRQRRSQ